MFFPGWYRHPHLQNCHQIGQNGWPKGGKPGLSHGQPSVGTCPAICWAVLKDTLQKVTGLMEGAVLWPFVSGSIHSLALRAIVSFHAKWAHSPLLSHLWSRQDKKWEHMSGKILHISWPLGCRVGCWLLLQSCLLLVHPLTQQIYIYIYIYTAFACTSFYWWHEARWSPNETCQVQEDKARLVFSGVERGAGGPAPPHPHQPNTGFTVPWWYIFIAGIAGERGAHFCSLCHCLGWQEVLLSSHCECLYTLGTKLQWKFGKDPPWRWLSHHHKVTPRAVFRWCGEIVTLCKHWSDFFFKQCQNFCCSYSLPYNGKLIRYQQG